MAKFSGQTWNTSNGTNGKLSCPEESKRRVRQRDGFGCVCCGLGIYQYDHFDSEFSEATAHHENGIISLCAACHAKKTRGLLS
jgi:hypothetical protein